MKEQIERYCSRYLEFNNNEIDFFYDCLIPMVFQNKEYLLKEDEICRNKFFIVKGLVRSFYIDSNGNEQIIQFGIENWWVTNSESFILEKPSLTFIQAIEDTTVLMINKKKLEQLYTTFPKFERLFRIITENTLIAIQRRHDFYMKMNSIDRYYFFINELPNFVQRIPQYMIASYLGITPEYLSSLRKGK